MDENLDKKTFCNILKKQKKILTEFIVILNLKI